MRSTLTVESLHDRVDGREGQGGEDALSVHTLIKDIVCGGDLRSGNLLAPFQISIIYSHTCISR